MAQEQRSIYVFPSIFHFILLQMYWRVALSKCWRPGALDAEREITAASQLTSGGRLSDSPALIPSPRWNIPVSEKRSIKGKSRTTQFNRRGLVSQKKLRTRSMPQQGKSTSCRATEFTTRLSQCPNTIYSGGGGREERADCTQVQLTWLNWVMY